ncbi:hypothetical protein HKX48_008142, partial [Thoreauomyces humboldtii]
MNETAAVEKEAHEPKVGAAARRRRRTTAPGGLKPTEKTTMLKKKSGTAPPVSEKQPAVKMSLVDYERTKQLIALLSGTTYEFVGLSEVSKAHLGKPGETVGPGKALGRIAGHVAGKPRRDRAAERRASVRAGKPEPKRHHARESGLDEQPEMTLEGTADVQEPSATPTSVTTAVSAAVPVPTVRAKAGKGSSLPTVDSGNTSDESIAQPALTRATRATTPPRTASSSAVILEHLVESTEIEVQHPSKAH